MRAMPFAFDEFGFTRSAMGVDYHLIPPDARAVFWAYRMRAENIPGASRKDIPGGDRYHLRKALFKMLEQLMIEYGM